MTLDIAKFISNSIKTQAKIHHLDVNTKTVRKNDIPESVSKIIISAYGQKYLLDSDYVSFFWGGIDKDNIEKLFNVVDKALGKSANKLTDKDFKKIDIDSSKPNDQSDDEPEEKDEESDEIEVDDEVEDIIDEEPDENFDAEEEIEDDEESKSLNEDDENDEDDISSKPTSYFFLKITLK